MGSRANFAKQCANLWAVKQRILEHLSMDLNGYCAVKDEHYYGFEGYLTINLEGGISERRRTRVLPETTQGISGLLIGDKGYIRPLLRQDLFEQWIDLQTPLRKNMDDNRPESFVQQLMSARRLVETVIGQLTERFNIKKVRA